MFTPFAFVKQAAAAPAPANGPLTAAFLAATGITGSANIQALNDFETGLTTYSLTSKFTAIYPLMGGNSTATSYNFLDTGSYRITWSGTLTFNINGVQTTNGGGGYGDTAIPATLFSPTEGHECAWITSDEGPEALGTSPYASDWGFTGDINAPDLTQYYTGLAQGAVENALINAYPVNPSINSAAGGVKTAIPAAVDRPGIWINSRQSATDNVLYRNNSVWASTTTSSGTRSYSSFTSNLYILSRGGSGDNSPRRQGFHTVGAGSGKSLTSTQAGNLYDLITAFNTTAGR
jgi:hypothetical protein